MDDQIQISESTKAEVEVFTKPEWRLSDLEHYGGPVDWNEKEFVFKAEKEGKILGAISGKYEGGILQISNLIVSHKVRNSGIGKKLIKRAEEFGRHLGAHKAQLETGEDWEARKFYDSQGYVKVADLPDLHIHKNFVIYQKKL